MTTSDRIRALHAAEPYLAPAELARKCETSRQLVRRAIGNKKGGRRGGPPPSIRPMDGAEFGACLQHIGGTRAWLARWFGCHVSGISARINGSVAVRPAEAALMRLIISEAGELERAIKASAPSE